MLLRRHLRSNPASISAACHQRLHARYKIGRLQIAARPDQVAYLGHELVHVWIFRREPSERAAEPQLVLEVGRAFPLGLGHYKIRDRGLPPG